MDANAAVIGDLSARTAAVLASIKVLHSSFVWGVEVVDIGIGRGWWSV